MYTLQWLEEEFLKYIDDWESMVMQLEQVPSAERRKMCLSEETIEGLRITGTGALYISPTVMLLSYLTFSSEIIC